jgi:hypothetical protein
MAFYYISIFSIIPLGVAYGVLGLVYWGLVRATRGVRARTLILSVVGVIFLVLPISEELWIAWNFAQACRQAGTFISKKVQVEGFYDDTRSSHAGKPTAQAVESFEKSGYRFVEMKADGKVVRVEKINGEWKPTLLDRPTAKYHFRMPSNHAPLGHRITKHETVVVDTTGGDVLGRYTRFSRDAPWFYWSIKGDYSCDAPGRWPLTRGNFSIYRDILQPASR